MEPIVNTKPKTKSISNTVPIRINKSTARLLRTIISKINKKPLGKKVRADHVIIKALELLTDDHLEEIKKSTYSSHDHLEIEFKKFCQQHGQISKDEFLKKILTTAVPHMSSENL